MRSRRTGGRRAQRSGAAWQRVLEHWHRAYRRDRRAVVVPTNQPVRLIRELGKGKFEGVWSGKGPVDYVGTLAGGRALAFDAKSTEGERWALSDLAEHQAKQLEATHIAGGAAFVVLLMQGRAWVLPWSELGPVYWRWAEGDAARGEASLTAEDCDEIGQAFDPRLGGDGWLGVFE